MIAQALIDLFANAPFIVVGFLAYLLLVLR